MHRSIYQPSLPRSWREKCQYVIKMLYVIGTDDKANCRNEADLDNEVKAFQEKRREGNC